MKAFICDDCGNPVMVVKDGIVSGGCTCPVQVVDERVRDLKPRAYATHITLAVPPRFVGGFDKLVETPLNHKAIEATKAWAKSRDWLYIHGGVGVGKTHLAWAVIGSLLDQGTGVHYVKASHMVNEVKACSADMRHRKVLEFGRDHFRLIINEFGREPQDDWGQEILMQIIDERYEWGRPTMFTSNYSIAEIGRRPKSSAVADRMKHLCLEIEIKGESKRKPVLQ